MKLVTFEDDDLDQNEDLEAALRKRYETLVAGEAPVERVTLPWTFANQISPRLFPDGDGAKLSPAFGTLGGLRVGDEEAVKKLAEEGVKFLTGEEVKRASRIANREEKRDVEHDTREVARRHSSA